LPVIEGRLGYILGIVIGSIITAIMVNLLKKVNTDKTDYKDDLDDIELNFEEL